MRTCRPNTDLTAALALILAFCAAPTGAVVVIDQQQSALDPTPQLVGLGQTLAQTVTAGVDGRLVAVDLALDCTSGRLIVEIVGLDGNLPGTAVLGSATLEGAGLPTDVGAFTTIALRRPVPQAPGDRFAIVVRNEGGQCDMSFVVSLDRYPFGSGFVDNDILPPGWNESVGGDLSFRTRVDVHGTLGAGACQVHGLGPIPLPVPAPFFSPVCRCLQDESLREFRCALVHPDLFLMRRFASPFDAGKAFEVEWTLMALAPIQGKLQLSDRWPDGFKTSLGGPLSFDAAALQPGEAVTLSYQVTAPAVAKGFKLRTDLHFDQGDIADGSMETRVDVRRLKP